MREIARWNGERDCWETNQIDLLSGLPVVYTETWPPSAMTRNNVLYELPTLVPHTDGSGSSFSQPDGMVFDTPDTMPDAPNSGSNRRSQPAGLGNQVKTLLPTPRSNEANGIGEHGTGGQDLRTTIDALLPTPQAHDHVQGKTSEQVEAMRERTGAGVRNLNEVATNELLPTPRAADHTHSVDAPAAMAHVEAGNGALAEVIGYHLLPTPKAGDADFGMPRTSGRSPEKSTHLMTRMEYSKPESSWGPYAAAIHRWEQVLGRVAPDPTEIGPKGGRRLASRFVEWLMGCVDGWVTGVGLTRTQELKALGNGVVTQQARYALSLMNNEIKEALA